MWQTAHFLDRFGSPVRIVSLDAPFRHTDGEEVSRVKSLPDRGPSVLAKLAHHEMQSMVRKFIEGLPKRDQEIIRGVYWAGETQTAIANRLGVSKMAISKAVARITKQARRVLPEYEQLSCSN